MKRGLYQGWTGWRNLGDEAMFDACRLAFPRLHWTPLPLQDSLPEGWSRDRARDIWRRSIRARLGGHAALLGGGTIINRTPVWLEQYRRLQRTLKRPIPVFSPGVAHPEYWSRKAGWRDTRAEWREALANLPDVGVRGPRSKRLLDEAGFRHVTVTGDPALLLRRVPPRHRAGRRAVAVNAGRSNGEMWGDEDRTVAALADAVRALTARGFDVRVFPVWDRDEPACREVARAGGLSPDAVDTLMLDSGAFLDYLDRFDVVVSLKLHAAVLSAAAGVPFVAVEYRPKVRDFTESVGCGPLTVRSDELVGCDLARLVEELYDDLPAARDQLASRVTELSETFLGYARGVEDILLA